LDLSVIIPVHVFNDTVTTCLSALQEAQREQSFELIIVLDGIPKDAVFFGQFSFSDLCIIELPESRGPAFARNKGVEKATKEILFFTDSDVEINTETLSKIEAHFKTPNAAEALIGSYDDQPANTSLISKYRNLLHHYTHQMGNTKASTFWGACGAVRKNVFQELGGFNTNYAKPSIEDIELGYRIKNAHYRIKLDSSLQVKHLKKWTLRKMVYTDVFLRAKPWTVLLHQHKNWNLQDFNTQREEKIAVGLLAAIGFSMVTAIFHPFALVFSLLLSLSLIVLKRYTYIFFKNHFSAYEMPLLIGLHWIYLFSAGLGGFLGTVEYYLFAKKH